MRIIVKPAAKGAPNTEAVQEGADVAPAPAPAPASQPSSAAPNSGQIISVVTSSEPKLNYYSFAETSSTRISKEETIPEKSEKSEKPEKDAPPSTNSKRLKGSPPPGDASKHEGQLRRENDKSKIMV